MPKSSIKQFNKLKGFQQCGGTNDILGDLLKLIMICAFVLVVIGSYFC